MLAICTLSNGNVDAERGFSINKYLLQIHGPSTSEKTIEAIRYAKDYINVNGGEDNIVVTKLLIKECQCSCQRWKENLKLEKEMKKKEQESRKEVESKKKADQEKECERKKIESDIETIRCGIQVANDLISIWPERFGKFNQY